MNAQRYYRGPKPNLAHRYIYIASQGSPDVVFTNSFDSPIDTAKAFLVPTATGAAYVQANSSSQIANGCVEATYRRFDDRTEFVGFRTSVDMLYSHQVLLEHAITDYIMANTEIQSSPDWPEDSRIKAAINCQVTGHNCKSCNDRNDYAEANQSDGSYICYRCR